MADLGPAWLILVLNEQAILDESAHDAVDEAIQEFFQVLLVCRVLNGPHVDGETSTERIGPTGEKQSQRPAKKKPAGVSASGLLPNRQSIRAWLSEKLKQTSVL
jgi:hypothetical protein